MKLPLFIHNSNYHYQYPIFLPDSRRSQFMYVYTSTIHEFIYPSNLRFHSSSALKWKKNTANGNASLDLKNCLDIQSKILFIMRTFITPFPLSKLIIFFGNAPRVNTRIIKPDVSPRVIIYKSCRAPKLKTKIHSISPLYFIYSYFICFFIFFFFLN